MLLLRVAGLAFLICLHLFGAAALFRRLCPRESPWWGFFLPMLGLVIVFNFIEHFVALASLGWLLPVTAGGMTWAIISYGSWRSLHLPVFLYAGVFIFALAIRCLQPDINFYNTEGLTDLTRIVAYSLGSKVPPPDCWLPPYPYVGYYGFMHYGASVLKRLLSVDVGTAYNIGMAMLTSLTMLAGAAIAHSLGRYRTWPTALTLLALLSGMTGSTPIRALLHPSEPNPAATIDMGVEWDNPQHNPFNWLLKYFPPETPYRVYTPGCYIFYSEFHATIAGQLIVLLTLFAAVEVFRRKRTVVPWAWLLVAPALIVITCPWFFFIVVMLAWPTLLWVILQEGRQPLEWRAVLVAAAVTFALIWPTLSSLTLAAIAQPFHLYTSLNRDFGMFLVQFWPVYLPWLALAFLWQRFRPVSRWFYLLIIPIFFFTEMTCFADRGTTQEKTLGGVFALGLVTLYPLIFLQRHFLYRGLAGLLLASALISLAAWSYSSYNFLAFQASGLRIEGDSFIRQDPSLQRMEDLLRRLHAQTVLPGKNTEAFFESPCLPAFTENRCYVGWTNAEESCGHPDEAHLRAKQTNDFYDGTMAEPRSFLQANDIGAVLVWPTDKMSDAWLEGMKKQLTPDYAYFDCRAGGENNAGVFLRPVWTR